MNTWKLKDTEYRKLDNFLGGITYVDQKHSFR